MSDTFVSTGVFTQRGQHSNNVHVGIRTGTTVSVNLGSGFVGTVSLYKSIDNGVSWASVASYTQAGTSDYTGAAIGDKYRLSLDAITSGQAAYHLFLSDNQNLLLNTPGNDFLAAVARRGGNGGSGGAGSVTLSNNSTSNQVATATGFTPAATAGFYKNGTSLGSSTASTAGVATYAATGLANGDVISAGSGGISVGSATASVSIIIPTTPLWNAALAKVKAGTGDAKFLAVGDSTTLGLHSNNGAPGTTDQYADGVYGDRFIASLVAAGYNATRQNTWGTAGTSGFPSGAFDSRWTGSGWTIGSAQSLGGGTINAPNTSTSTVTWTSTAAFDTCDIYYVNTSTGGTFTVNVDGGSTLATVNTVNATQSIQKVTISTTLATHAINIQRTTGGAVYIVGFDCYNSAIKQVHMMNSGWSGSKVADWVGASTTYGAIPAIKAIAPDLTVINLTINDWVAATDVTAYTSGLQSLITAGKVSGDVIMAIGAPSQTTAASQAQQQIYRTIVTNLASSNSLLLLDPWPAFTDWATANTAGWMNDSLHCTYSGYGQIETLLAALCVH